MTADYGLAPQKTAPGSQPDIYSRKWVILAVVSVGILISTLDSSMVNIAAPAIAATLGILPQTAQWVVTAYLLGITATLLLFGRVGDIIGGKPVYALGFLLFALGSGLSSQAGNINSLAFCRAFQAMGASMLMSTGMGIVTAWFPPSQRGQALGITGSVVAIGTLTGPLLGGLIVGTWDWHAIFYLNIFIGVIGFFLAYLYLPGHTPFQLENNDPGFSPSPSSQTSLRKRLAGQLLNLRQELDWTGFVLSALGITGLLLTLGQGPAWGWQSPTTIICGSSGIILLLIFFRFEKSSPSPLLDLSLFQSWTFTTGIIASVLAYAVSIFVSFWMPFYLEGVLLLAPQRMGLIMAAIPLTMGFISPTAGWLSDRIDYRALTGAGLVLATLSLINLARLGPASTPVQAAAGLAFFGLGIAVFNSPNNSSIMGSAPLPKLGVAGGVVATGRNLGMVLGVTLSAAVFTFFSSQYALTPPPLPKAGASSVSIEIFARSITRVFQAAALISAAAAGLSLYTFFTPKSRCR